MKTNIKDKLKQGQVLIGTMAKTYRSPEIAQMMAVAGFDFFIIDTEHFPYNPQTVSDIIRAARGAGIDCIVRVPGKCPHLLSLPLDYGAQGLMVPHVDTDQQARQIIETTKYYPLGLRGMSPASGHSDYLKVEDTLAFMKQANEQTFIMAQVESETAVNNIDQILSVQGIDAVFIGPFDLSQTLKIPGQINHPKMQECIEKVIDACRRHNVTSAMQVYNAESAANWIKKGMGMISCRNDLSFFLTSAAAEIKNLRSLL